MRCEGKGGSSRRPRIRARALGVERHLPQDNTGAKGIHNLSGITTSTHTHTQRPRPGPSPSGPKHRQATRASGREEATHRAMWAKANPCHVYRSQSRHFKRRGFKNTPTCGLRAVLPPTYRPMSDRPLPDQSNRECRIRLPMNIEILAPLNMQGGLKRCDEPIGKSEVPCAPMRSVST